MDDRVGGIEVWFKAVQQSCASGISRSGDPIGTSTSMCDSATCLEEWALGVTSSELWSISWILFAGLLFVLVSTRAFRFLEGGLPVGFCFISIDALVMCFVAAFLSRDAFTLRILAACAAGIFFSRRACEVFSKACLWETASVSL